MKKILFMGVALTMALAFTSCKSSESAYKKAYEKAQQAQQGQQNQNPGTVQTSYNNNGTTQTTVEVAPVTTTPTTSTQTTTDYSNVTVRTESVSLVSGGALKAYSVVVGSFSVKANAESLSQKLSSQGLTPRVVKTKVNGNDFYRVIAGSFDSKNEAASFRVGQQATYKDAWLLYSK